MRVVFFLLQIYWSVWQLHCQAREVAKEDLHFDKAMGVKVDEETCSPAGLRRLPISTRPTLPSVECITMCGGLLLVTCQKMWGIFLYSCQQRDGKPSLWLSAGILKIFLAFFFGNSCPDNICQMALRLEGQLFWGLFNNRNTYISSLKQAVILCATTYHTDMYAWIFISEKHCV